MNFWNDSMISNELKKQEIKSSDILDLICYRSKTNILALREYVGDHAFLAILDKFAGTYIKFPKADKVYEVVEDATLAMLYEIMKEKKRSKNLREWNDAEFRFNKQCDKMGIKWEVGRRRAVTILSELRQVHIWQTEMRQFDREAKNKRENA